MKSKSILIKQAEKAQREMEVIAYSLVRFQRKYRCKLIYHIPMILTLLKGDSVKVKYWRRGEGNRFELIDKTNIILNFFEHFGLSEGLQLYDVGLSQEMEARFFYCDLKYKKYNKAIILLKAIEFLYTYYK